MSQNSWFEHFKEQLQGLTEAFESSGSPLSMLGYALKEQRLSSEEYFKWAVAQHQLPKLQSRFFTETPLSQEMFAKWATHYRWSAECLPVAEWDGSLIVACLQPPQDFPSFPTSVLVLTEFEDLQKAWAYFHPEKSVSAPPPEAVSSTVEAAPASVLQKVDAGTKTVDLSAKTVSAKKSDSFSFEDLGVSADEASESTNSGVEESEEKSSEEESNPDDALAGLFDAPTVVKLEAVGGSPTAPTTHAAPVLEPTIPVVIKDAASAPLTATTPILEKTSSILEKTVVLEKTPPEATSSGLTGLSKITPPAPPPMGLPKVAEPAVPKSAPVTASTPPPAPEADPVFEESFGNRQMPVVPRPTGVAKPTVNPVASGNFALDKLKKKNSAIINDRIKSTLSEMKIYFDKSMILTIDDQETQIVAFAWDENFQGIKDTSMRFPLKTPSIFNIVVSTQKPFHGYVSLNEVNERFFDDWNQGVVPDHVTITPFMVNDKIVGLLVGFADKTAYNKVSLGLAEKLCSDFVKGLQAA